MMDSGLAGKSILITGAAQGLGFATARTLAARGARVFLGDVNAEKVAAAARELEHANYSASAVSLDVTEMGSVTGALKRVTDAAGKLDVLINNAGIDVTKPVSDITVEEWDRVVAVNLRGPFIMTKLALEVMAPNKSGHIVNICSTASKRTWPNASAYHATKWGLLGFSHALFTEARSSGIGVTAVIAGGMKTPFILERFPGTDASVLQEPDHVAETIAFVLTRPTGTVIPEIMVIPVMETSWP